ncbi:hypothetical protein [Paenibacillus ihumii]|uniref:hypothetical protein n=1 Tax=Paenibacillus ihumii TaxID=687436 RepID=UPI0006D7A9AF|nr:hypothetical protein [Paenibacillus ihumii]
MNKASLNEAKFETLLNDPSLKEQHRELIAELLSTARQLSAENTRLRRTLLKKSSGGQRMSSKLKDALYE